MFWKPILTLIVCLVGGILWAKSERNKRMVPIIIALVPCLDVVFVQIPMIQRIYEHMTVMTTVAGGCTIGLGDFAFGGFLLGVLFVACRSIEVKWVPTLLIGCGAVVMLILGHVGLLVATQLPKVMLPQTPWLAIAVLPALGVSSGYWVERSSATDVKVYRSEVKMMATGWRLLAACFIIAVGVFIVRL